RCDGVGAALRGAPAWTCRLARSWPGFPHFLQLLPCAAVHVGCPGLPQRSHDTCCVGVCGICGFWSLLTAASCLRFPGLSLSIATLIPLVDLLARLLSAGLKLETQEHNVILPVPERLDVFREAAVVLLRGDLVLFDYSLQLLSCGVQQQLLPSSLVGDSSCIDVRGEATSPCSPALCCGVAVAIDCKRPGWREEEEQQTPAEAHNSGGGAWQFNSVEQVSSDPALLTTFSVTAILMFSKAGVIVYASKLGPETDAAVYRIFPYNVQYDSGTVRRRFFMYQSFILVFTFACYTAYHLSRKPISVVKSVLHRDCSAIAAAKGIKLTNENKSFCSWKPFAVTLLSAPICATIFGCGMLLSGLTTALFGLGYYWDVHSMTYFILVQRAVWCRLLVGQALGLWLACGNWFGKGRDSIHIVLADAGFIMGVWNSHTSTGNILGSILAGLFVNISWGLSFIEIRTDDEQPSKPPSSVSQSLIKSVKGKNVSKRRSLETLNLMMRHPWRLAPAQIDCPSLMTKKLRRFRQKLEFKRFASNRLLWSLKIPGVIEYSMCLFFAKLLFTYEKFGGTSLTHSIVLLFITGGFVNASVRFNHHRVSADLGTACGSSARALATVTAIIDGAGSLGAAFGPLLTGLIVRTGWRNVFYMLIGADLAALSISLPLL
uniref:MFS domain-containing protein n=1 Tax=Macrostomum lignano TaxID=282301 RepID=A0A1I8F182_9PLAT